MNNKLFGVILLIIFLCIIFAGCPVKKEEPIGLTVNNVYYYEATDDQHIYDNTFPVGSYKKMSFLAVDLSTSQKLVKKGENEEPDWKSICTAEGNVITWSGRGNGPLFIPRWNFELRVQNPYDLTNDVGKRVFFDTNYIFEIDYSGGEGGGSAEVYISTSLKEINFELYKNYLKGL